MELLLAILGGSVGSALVAGTFGLIQWRLNRKAQKEDQASARKAADSKSRDEELEDIKKKMDVLVIADRTILYDRIKHLGKSYIERGYVTMEELEDLNLMHSVYHDKDKLNGNGFLDNVMAAVRALPLRSK